MSKITDLRIGMECRVYGLSKIKITGISTKTYGVNESGAYEEIVILFSDGRELTYKEACELFNNQPEF